MRRYAFVEISSVRSKFPPPVKDEAAAAARELLFEHVGASAPVDPFRVAEALEVHVAEDRLDPDVSGILQLRRDTRPLIILNIADSVRRKRFTCAHELGHLVRHKDKDDYLEIVDYRDEAASKGEDAEERFANAFAASFLMPEHLVEQRVAVGEGEAEMADYFQVSQVALVNRLKGLGFYRR